MQRRQVTRSEQAVVIGGSIAGLLAARVLSDHFIRVLVIDRDHFPATPGPRKGVAQSYQPHILLGKGLSILSELMPEFPVDLLSHGAHEQSPADWRLLFHAGSLLSYETDRRTIGASRALIEWTLRREVQRIPNVRFLPGHQVVRLCTTSAADRVTGVSVRSREGRSANMTVAADLVVDASGRSAMTIDWLEDLGYDRPPEETINAGVGYSSRFYHRSEQMGHLPNLLIQPRPPDNPRLGALMAVEDDRWQVMLGGLANHIPPTDEAGFLDWARHLPEPDLFERIQAAEPASPIRGFRVPTTRLRRFERLRRWPSGFVVMGDAVASFNPLYGQGMSVAAMEAHALAEFLVRKPPSGWERQFQKRVARIAQFPWEAGMGEDLRWEGVSVNGKPASRRVRLLNRYIDRVTATATRDPVVSEAFINVINLVATPPSLFRPSIAGRVLKERVRPRQPKWGSLAACSVPSLRAERAE